VGFNQGVSDREGACDWGQVIGDGAELTAVNDLPSVRRDGRASDYSNPAALLLTSFLTAASKEYLINKRQIIFRFADSAFPQLYCLKFLCK